MSSGWKNVAFQSWVYGQIMVKISRAILQMIPISQWALVFFGPPGATSAVVRAPFWLEQVVMMWLPEQILIG